MKIRREEAIQFFKFVIVGAVNSAINLFVLYILTDFFHVYYIISAVFAFLIAVTNSFIMNKTWTFQEKVRHKVALKYTKFIVVSVTALLFNLLLLYVLVEYFGVWYMLAQLIGIIFNFIINFFGNKIWTFKK